MYPRWSNVWTKYSEPRYFYNEEIWPHHEKWSKLITKLVNHENEVKISQDILVYLAFLYPTWSRFGLNIVKIGCITIQKLTWSQKLDADLTKSVDHKKMHVHRLLNFMIAKRYKKWIQIHNHLGFNNGKEWTEWYNVILM